MDISFHWNYYCIFSAAMPSMKQLKFEINLTTIKWAIKSFSKSSEPTHLSTNRLCFRNFYFCQGFQTSWGVLISTSRQFRKKNMRGLEGGKEFSQSLNLSRTLFSYKQWYYDNYQKKYIKKNWKISIYKIIYLFNTKNVLCKIEESQIHEKSCYLLIIFMNIRSDIILTNHGKKKFY